MTRFKVLFIFFAIVWFVLLVRVFQISVGHGEYYETLARQNIIKKEWMHPIRGEIVDRNGKPLAVNEIGFSITVTPHLNANELDSVLTTISDKFGYEKEKLLKRYKEKNSYYNHDDIVLEEFVDYDLMTPHISLLEREQYIKIQPATLRSYPLSDAAAHIVGYVGRYSGNVEDETAKIVGTIGKNGLEKEYNGYLQGELGHELIMVNATNQKMEVLEYKPPVENNKLEITVDSDLQLYIHELFKDQAGAAIVMRTNGELLAAVSYPAYNPNMFVTGITQKEWDAIRFDFDTPFTNKFLNGLYPPGSVIKMGVGLSFFDAGDVNEHTSVVCNSDFEVGGHLFRCWKREGHGRVDFKKAIRESCDDYFYKNSIKTGINKIAEVLRQTGLGEKTGVDLPNESYGTVPDIPWKHRRHNQRWYMGETIISSIGQGYMLTTPLQIARHTAMLATDKLPTPFFVKPDDVNATLIEPEVVKRNKDAMKLIREGMSEVANAPGGTARWYLRESKVKMAAKTGTAQVISIPQDQKERMDESELEYYHRSHAWMNSYAPHDDPQFVVVALIEHGASGGQAAGPIITKIYNWLLENNYIKDKK
jgi:penicillin-binding protein 2